VAPVAASPAFTAGPAFAASTAVAVVTRCAVAAVTAVAARVVGCKTRTAGMHDGYAAHGVAARGGSGAQSDQCRSQSHPGSRAQIYGIKYLVYLAIPCAIAATSHWFTSLRAAHFRAAVNVVPQTQVGCQTHEFKGSFWVAVRLRGA
jgi:hypothetical protein